MRRYLVPTYILHFLEMTLFIFVDKVLIALQFSVHLVIEISTVPVPVFSMPIVRMFSSRMILDDFLEFLSAAWSSSSGTVPRPSSRPVSRREWKI